MKNLNANFFQENVLFPVFQEFPIYHNHQNKTIFLKQIHIMFILQLFYIHQSGVCQPSLKKRLGLADFWDTREIRETNWLV